MAGTSCVQYGLSKLTRVDWNRDLGQPSLSNQCKTLGYFIELTLTRLVNSLTAIAKNMLEKQSKFSISPPKCNNASLFNFESG